MIASAIINQFVTKTDKGSEYKLRYARNQQGQISFASKMMANFQTPAATREGTFQRSDEVVAAVFRNEAAVAAWRQQYATLPANSIQIISRWLKTMLKSGDDYDLMAAACFIFASRSTIEIVPDIEEFSGLLCACWTKTEKTGMPRLIPLPYEGISKSDYERLAIHLPLSTEWSAYRKIGELLDELQIPNFARKIILRSSKGIIQD